MSAYIVDDTTINNIVGAIYNDHSPRGFGDDLRRVLKYRHGILTEDGTGAYPQAIDPAWFACCLRALNEKAIGSRYGEKAIDEMRGGDFTFKNVTPKRSRSTINDGVRLFKSIQCLHYQCSEGNADADELYCILESLSHTLAHCIIYNLPEYEKADWA